MEMREYQQMTKHFRFLQMKKVRLVCEVVASNPLFHDFCPLLNDRLNNISPMGLLQVMDIDILMRPCMNVIGIFSISLRRRYVLNYFDEAVKYNMLFPCFL